MSKIVTIVGATGQQGQAVIAAFADTPGYKLRGITRNPSSVSAQALVAQGIEVVKADINDLDSTTAAFQGSHIIFAVTDFYALFQQHGPVKAKDLETQQGIVMAKAAAATASLEHYIWSTLPNGTKEYPVPHFEGKHAVDNFIKQDSSLLTKTTFLVVCFYANNLQIASFRPYWIDTVQKYVQFTTYSPDTPIPFIGDVRNITPFVKAIVDRADEVKNGTIVIGAVHNWTAKEWVSAWATAQGKDVQLVRVPREQYDELFPHPRWSEEFALMMDFFEHVPINTWLPPDSEVHNAESLQIVPVQTLDEWAKTWELPDAKDSTI
ncbi:hypothetical protein Golomagni_06842 [Golovinomyces magnicellulatus]|nr:hypothetical protein Golomagni_06842 [Golovinomyces magnicellulatus]